MISSGLFPPARFILINNPLKLKINRGILYVGCLMLKKRQAMDFILYLIRIRHRFGGTKLMLQQAHWAILYFRR
jgi:hypothetical protein